MATKIVYMVAYVNWKGEWVSLPEQHSSQAKAEAARRKIAKTKALNGRSTVYQV